MKEENIDTRVVSMPSWELFEKQNELYKEQVLPKHIKRRLAVEAGSVLGWHKYVTGEGDVIGMHEFGKSAPAEALFRHFGFTVENIIVRTKALLRK